MRDDRSVGTWWAAMTSKHWIAGLLLGVAIAFLVAAAMTYADWRFNPAGIFRGPDGTNWDFVWDTWISWFGPVLPAATAAVLVIAWLYSRFR